MLGSFLTVAADGQRDKPPGVVMKCTVVIAFMKTMEAKGIAKPEYPAFEVRLSLFMDQIVGHAKAHAESGYNPIKVRQP
jgi:hypothetical protein